MQIIELPVDYSKLSWSERKKVRNLYVTKQRGKCLYCSEDLLEQPPAQILNKIINWKLFPENFLKYPIHLQHNHSSGMTEGAVHAYCNAVMWQYESR